MTHERTKGVWYAVAAFSLWGVLPLYWKALKTVPSPQILAHRILWSSLYVVLILTTLKKLPEIGAAFSTWRQRLYILLCALVIGINWFIYIWAVNADHVVETSLGYFINPIVSILFGMIFLKERLTSWQFAAVGLVVAGVLFMTARLGRLPWISLALAASFGLYGLLRKKSHADSLVGIVLETLILSPACLLYIVLQTAGGKGAFGSAPLAVHALLVFSGAVTATPLLWFAHGARRIPLSMLGFVQYLAPSLQLVLGIFVFKEPFTSTHLVSFCIIWCAVAVYALTHTPVLGKKQARDPAVEIVAGE
jgi:chloramphenicol-sensitive protein RarD